MRESPDDPAVREPRPGWIEGAAGVRLRSWSWPVQNPRGRVQVVHGFSEHLRRYDEVAAALNRAGWSVFGHDHRGHGESEGARGVLKDFAHLTGDLGRVRAEADDLAPGPGTPLMISHSLGGLVAIRYLQESGAAVPRVVISAPWLGSRFRLSLLQKVAARVLLPIAPNLTLHSPMDTTKLTRDPVRAERYRNDPRIHRRGSAGLLARVRTAQTAALAEGLPAGTKALVVVPLADEVTDPDITLSWVRRRLDEEDVQVDTYPEGVHEPFQDLSRNEVVESVVEWLELQESGRPGSPRNGVSD